MLQQRTIDDANPVSTSTHHSSPFNYWEEDSEDSITEDYADAILLLKEADYYERRQMTLVKKINDDDEIALREISSETWTILQAKCIGNISLTKIDCIIHQFHSIMIKNSKIAIQ